MQGMRGRQTSEGSQLVFQQSKSTLGRGCTLLACEAAGMVRGQGAQVGTGWSE